MLLRSPALETDALENVFIFYWQTFFSPPANLKRPVLALPDSSRVHFTRIKSRVKTVGLVWSREVAFYLFSSSSVSPACHVHMEASSTEFSPQPTQACDSLTMVKERTEPKKAKVTVNRRWMVGNKTDMRPPRSFFFLIQSWNKRLHSNQWSSPKAMKGKEIHPKISSFMESEVTTRSRETLVPLSRGNTLHSITTAHIGNAFKGNRGRKIEDH